MSYNTMIPSESHKTNIIFVFIYFVLVTFWLENCLNVGNLIKGFSLSNLSLYFLILYWLFTSKIRDTFFQQNNVNRYLFILMAMIAVSIFPNVYGGGAQNWSLFKEIVSYKNLITPWLFFLLITALICDKKTCERLILGLSLFLLATVFAVFIENYLGVNLGTSDNIYAKGRSAGFSEVNQYAAFLVLFIPLYLSSVLFQEKWSKKAKAFSFLFFAFIALALTVSKGGFISLFISLGYFFKVAFRKKLIRKRRVFLLVPFLLTLATVSYIFLPSQTKEIAAERIALQEREDLNPWERAWLSEQSWAWKFTSGRTEIWMYSIKLFIQKPIFGYGNDACSIQLGLSPHSEPFKWLLNHGIIGFLLIAMVYIQIFRHVTYNLKTSTNPQSIILYIGYIAGFIGYVVAMFGVNLEEPRLIFWIYTAIIYKYTQLDAIREEQDNLAPSFQAK